MNILKRLKDSFDDAKAKRVKSYSDQGISQQQNLLELLEGIGLQPDRIQEAKDDLAISKKINGIYRATGINP